MDHTQQQKIANKSSNPLKSGQQKYCRDNDYLQNLANTDEAMKKRIQRTTKHSSNQYAMSTISYKPNNQEASNNVNIVRFAPEQQ
jgi:hypothetical protein